MNTLKTLSFCLIWLFMSPTTHGDGKNSSLESLRPITVYKSPTCGCCEEWVNHLKSADFSVKIKHPENLDQLKKMLDISPLYQSCHTGVKSGYYFEGHVPADVIRHFLKESPDGVAGLAVPGMPMGSPGMDVSGRYKPYEVLKINSDGRSTPYALVSVDGIVYLKKHSE